ncbi:Early growth response protein 2, partial [Clarias magur]
IDSVFSGCEQKRRNWVEGFPCIPTAFIQMSKHCENKVGEENRSFPCTRHLILRHHINVFW